MDQILTLKIDVTKIHKDALYIGQKGTARSWREGANPGECDQGIQ